MTEPQELLMAGPGHVSQMIGHAAKVARIVLGKAAAGDTNPIKLLLTGSPGIGKSAICRLLSDEISDHPTDVWHVSAAQLTPEGVRCMITDCHYVRSTWRVWWIEEADAVSSPVEILLLQLMDLMPEKTALLMTSNKDLGSLSDRLQSRAWLIEVETPDPADVAKFILKGWPALGSDVAQEIAAANGGDVRSSLNDVQMALDAERYNMEVNNE